MGKVLQLNLLGSFHLHWEDEPVREVNSPRLQALLAYLLLNRHTTLSRRQIAFQFWPDSSEPQAFANLRTLFAHLRRALPEADHFIYLDAHCVQWNNHASFRLDVEVFESAISNGSLEKAASVYGGDLLPDCYDDWIAPERERLRQVFCRTMEKLIQTREEARDYEGAIQYAHILLQHDQLRESTYCRLMLLYALQEDRSEAVRVFHQCSLILKRELGVEPGPNTRKVYEQLLLLSNKPQAGNVNLNSMPLIGRKHEWQLLLQRWKAAAAGDPELILMMGESGVGKTRLLEEFREWAHRQGITTVYTRCYATQGRMAYAPAVDWLRCPEIGTRLGSLDSIWLVEIARLLPEITVKFPRLPKPARVKEGWQRMHLFEAMARAVFAASQPLLLIMDDVQWADLDTLAWLSYLVRFNIQSELLVVCAARPEEPVVDQTLQDLRLELQREQRLFEFELNPLDRSDTQKLAAVVDNASCTPEEAEQIFLETEGNPLFVVEMVRRRGVKGGEEKQLPIIKMFNQSARLPDKVEAVIGYRLSELSGPAQALAALAATCGRQFSVEVLLKAWKSSEEKLIEGLEELVRRRIVREQGLNGYDFTHDKIREAVCLRLSQAHRRLLHRSLAQALEAIYGEEIDAISGEIATHYQQAGLDRFALPYFLRAGEVASRLFANQEAIRLLRCGLSIVTASLPDRNHDGSQTNVNFSLLDVLGDVLERTGQHQQAREAFQLVFDYCPNLDPVKIAQTHRKIGQTWLPLQSYDRALQSYEEAERALEVHCRNTPHHFVEGYPEWVNIIIGRMWVFYYLGETEKMQDIATEILPTISTQGSPQQRADLYGSISAMIMRRERYTGVGEAIDYHYLALEAAKDTGEQGLIAFAYFNLGFSHLWEGLLNAAEEFLLESKTIAEKIGDENTLILSLTYLCVVYRKMGRVVFAREAIQSSLELATRGQRTMYVAMARANQAWLAWQEGNYRQVQELGEAALEMWSHLPITYAFCWAALWPLLAASLVEEDIDTAIHHARGLISIKLQPQPGLLAETLEKCITYWEASSWQNTRLQLWEAVRLAGEFGYL